MTADGVIHSARMARRRKQMPLWLLVLIVIAVGVGIYLERRADEKGIEDVVVVSNASEPPKREPTPQRQTPEHAPGPRDPAVNVALGLPSPASASRPEDYLVTRSQYTLSYNRDRGIPNWVAWHLSSTDLGRAERSQFAPDPGLPKGWYRVTPRDYSNSGYDRGHMAPSADRSLDGRDNAPTFFMTNIIPQSPDNNQGPWADLENYCRDLARKGNELYIVAGGAGPFSAIANGKVAVPATTWKVAIVIPDGVDDLDRIDARARVIAVAMPNSQGIKSRDWTEFATTVDEIERTTGYDLFSALPDDVEAALESRVGR